MPMPVMDIGQMVMLMFLGGMLMFVRVDSLYAVMFVSRVIMSMAVLVKENRMHMRMGMIFIDEQQRTADHQDGGDDK